MSNISAPSVAERTFRVLMAFDVKHREMNMSQISRRTDLPVATVHRLLQKMESMGALERSSAGLYSVGSLIWRLGLLSPTHDVFLRGDRRILVRLSQDLSGDVRVYALSGEGAMCVQEVLQATRAPGPGLGTIAGLTQHAPGIVLARGLSPEDRSGLPLTRASYERFERQVQEGQNRGFVMLTTSESVELSVPIDAGPAGVLALTINVDEKNVANRTAIANHHAAMARIANSYAQRLTRQDIS